VLICGSKFSGKSTCCKILLNYACRLQHRPTFVDLDVFNNEIGYLPGTFGTVVVNNIYPH